MLAHPLESPPEYTDLVDAIKHAKVAERCKLTACGLDHAKLARWLEELHLRRTGRTSGVDIEATECFDYRCADAGPP